MNLSFEEAAFDKAKSQRNKGEFKAFVGVKFKNLGEVEVTLDRKEGKNVTAGHSSAAIVGRSAKRSDAHVLNLGPNIS